MGSFLGRKVGPFIHSRTVLLLADFNLERLFLLLKAKKVLTHSHADSVVAALPLRHDEIIGVETVFFRIVVQEVRLLFDSQRG